MKKVIIISLEQNNYVIKCDDKVVSNINIDTLVINGRDFYDNLFSKISLEDKLEIDIIQDGTTIIDSKDKRLTNDIKIIIEKIVDTINCDFNLNEKNIEHNIDDSTIEESIDTNSF